MGTPQWASALIFQIGIAVIGVIVAVLVLRVRFHTAALAALLFNSITIAKPPGFETPLFIHDFLLPILLIYLLFRLSKTDNKFVLFAAFAIFLLHLPGTVLGSWLNIGVKYGWVSFLYRRLGSLVFLLLGVTGILRRVRANEFLETCVVLWIGMAAVGLMQFLGFVEVNYLVRDDTFLGATIMQSTAAQKGFLGLNRGAVGLWGATISTYCVAILVLDSNLGVRRFVIYTLAASLSYAVILFSGSRTGLLASAGAIVFLGLRAMLMLKYVKAIRVVAFGILGISLLFFLVMPGARVVLGRLEGISTFQPELVQNRVRTQLNTIRFVVTNLRAATMGMGGGAGYIQFKASVGGLSQPHNEYLQILWESGIVGLVLYLFLLWKLYFGMKPATPGCRSVLGIAAQSAFVSGMIAALAVGNFMITDARLATYGMVMLFIYGLVMAQMRRYDEAASYSQDEWSELETAGLNG
ncbi:MAG: O-antigen ligase family protein [Phycisphaerae bacterium]|nr:O-antigen ligase family protein [Phycisphaerae bacterium]